MQLDDEGEAEQDLGYDPQRGRARWHGTPIPPVENPG